MIHLRSASLAPGEHGAEFPFAVPAIRTLPTIAFESPVTFLVGKNGSGKSTLLEALALAPAAPAPGPGSRSSIQHSRLRPAS
ncbi:MAG TPA: AAA family ATPase [Gemmatimonadaceae bacterium]